MPEMAARPDCIVHWQDIESSKEARHPANKEPRAFMASLSRATGLTRLGVRHERLMPGRRSSPPHAERDEEELVVILEGTPDLWQDGQLYRLRPGIVVAWPDRTGIAHSLLNNSETPVRYLSIGEASRYTSRVAFPKDPEIAAWFETKGQFWTDPPPRRRLGAHDGKPGKAEARADLPPNAIDWQAVPIKTGNTYPEDLEILCDFVPLNPLMKLGRIGGGIDPLLPGRRTSWPHAEGDEEEFTFVLEGTPDVWLDGRLYRLRPGDFVGWPSGTGLTHTVINNTDQPAYLATFGEASRSRSRVWYPFNVHATMTPEQQGWRPAVKRRFGPHDGLPNVLRAPAKPTRRKTR